MPPEEANGEELVGTVLGGRYRVTAVIGRGGMGVVARAVDELLDREVAVKVLRAYTDASGSELADLRARMQREAQAAARIRHGGVVTVHDVTEERGLPVIVMELVDGPSLDNVLAQRGSLDPRAAAAVGAEIMSALDAAHRAGVLHRDVKPANVLLEPGGRVVLTDFGIASMESSGDEALSKLTRSGELVGSLDYLPPERAQGQEPGPASDIWSLGMTLYACVEGTSPFRRTSVWSTLSAIVTEPLPEPRRAGPLAPVLKALMAKDPRSRPTADQARAMLEQVAAGATSDLAAPAGTPGAGPVPAAAAPTPTAPSSMAPPTMTPPSTAPPTGAPAPAPAAFGPPPAAASAAGAGAFREPCPQSAYAGYAPPGQPTVPSQLPPPRRGGSRGRRAALIAGAAAAVIAAGGATYALAGPDGSTGRQQARTAVPPGGSPAAGGQAGAGGTAPQTSRPSRGGPAGGPSAPVFPGPKGTGSPSPRSTAPAAAGPSPVPTACGGWSHRDPHPGTYGYMSGDYHLETGPYQNCPAVSLAKTGTKVWYHCTVVNAHGNKWTYVRIEGTNTAGWMSNDNLTRQNGPSTAC
ncbi:serine/threonine-protein kinase [Streptomyces sp. NPDC006326]|uniref:serine/threonine-protein kinase n=1 Tax=Streptomyces sp. NPDC006326 TaxID=3156752 RepID=UPI0033A6D7D6